MIERIVFLVVFFPFFLVAIMFHEVAHGYAAMRAGDPTAKYAGRLSLNPMVHIDPVGLMFFLISAFAGVGFGWAKPVPVNPIYFRNGRRDMIIVSLAGVAANLTLMIIALIFTKILLMAGVFNFAGERAAGFIFQLIIYFILLNGILIVFNLIPVPPLDGSKVLMMLLPREQAMAFARLQQYGFLILFGLLFFGVLNPLFVGAQKIIMVFVNYFLLL